MKIWTVQPLFIYDQLINKQTYQCDELLCPWRDEEKSQQAYQWMAQKMTEKISLPPEGVKYPIWAWHTINGKHKTPDLRHAMFRNYTEPQVCIELEIPDEEVLLSDFEAWQLILNDRYLDFSFSEEEHNQAMVVFDAMSKDEQLKAKLASWEKVFFIIPYQNAWTRIGNYVQATFWEIKPEYIKSVRIIKAKKETISDSKDM